MTPFAIAMLVFGLAVGTLISSMIFISQIKTIMARLENSLTVMEVHYKSLRGLYDVFYTTSNERIDSIVDNISKFYDIEIDTHKNIDERFKELARITNEQLGKLGESYNNLFGYVDSIHDDISGMTVTSDNRWDLIYDFMTNKKQEAQHTMQFNLERLLKIIGQGNPDITITPGWDPNRFIIEMYASGQSVECVFDTSIYSSSDDLEEAFLKTTVYLQEKLQEKIFPEHILKGGTINEHEEMAAGAGAPEGGDAGHQEAEQDAVLPGKADGKLVQSELAKDRLGDSPEAEEGQGLDVSILHAAVDAKMQQLDVAYDYDQH